MIKSSISELDASIFNNNNYIIPEFDRWWALTFTEYHASPEDYIAFLGSNEYLFITLSTVPLSHSDFLAPPRACINRIFKGKPISHIPCNCKHWMCRRREEQYFLTKTFKAKKENQWNREISTQGALKGVFKTKSKN